MTGKFGKTKSFDLICAQENNKLWALLSAPSIPEIKSKRNIPQVRLELTTPA